MKELIEAFSRYSNGVSKAFVENGIDVIETYFRETGSNARVYITAIYDFIKIEPYVKAATDPRNSALITLNISAGSLGPGGINYYDTYFSFMARFGGKAVVVMVPYTAVTLIWSPDTQDLALSPPEPADVMPGSPLDKILKQAAEEFNAKVSNIAVANENQPVRAKPVLSLVADNTEKKNEKLH